MANLSSSTPLTTLTNYLSGEFENAAQSAESPTWFVHLLLWQIPVHTLTSDSTHTFFLEQSTVGANKPPYRQRIFQVTASNDTLRGEYFALSDPNQFIGAGTDIQKLSTLSEGDLVSLPDSESRIEYERTENGYRFKSRLLDGKLCSFDYAGQRKYVYLGFDIERSADGQVQLLTYDKGIDPDSGRGLWGALMGPFRMIKQQ